MFASWDLFFRKCIKAKQLPGGVSLNGEKIFSDAEKEIAMILAEGKDQYELPAMDMIGWRVYIFHSTVVYQPSRI